jgi:hypothetical protein
MNIRSAVLKLLHVNRQVDVAKLNVEFLKFFVVNVPKFISSNLGKKRSTCSSLPSLSIVSNSDTLVS